MFPYTFETVTAITLTVIGVILVLYFMVLKRKGWLTENSNEPSFYRCPNQECRKIFQKPIVLTDLSQTSPRVHSACPHCGFDLEMASPSAIGKKTKMTFKIPRSSEESVVTVKTSKPETSAKSTEISEKPTAAKDIQKPPTASPKPPQARPPKCSHFFGYLRKIPRSTQIPDECFSCPKMVECLSYDASEQTMSK